MAHNEFIEHIAAIWESRRSNLGLKVGTVKEHNAQFEFLVGASTASKALDGPDISGLVFVVSIGRDLVEVVASIKGE